MGISGLEIWEVRDDFLFFVFVFPFLFCLGAGLCLLIQVEYSSFCMSETYRRLCGRVILIHASCFFWRRSAGGVPKINDSCCVRERVFQAANCIVSRRSVSVDTIWVDMCLV